MFSVRVSRGQKRDKKAEDDTAIIIQEWCGTIVKIVFLSVIGSNELMNA